jgi:hypothetical protein
MSAEQQHDADNILRMGSRQKRIKSSYDKALRACNEYYKLKENAGYDRRLLDYYKKGIDSLIEMRVDAEVDVVVDVELKKLVYISGIAYVSDNIVELGMDRIFFYKSEFTEAATVLVIVRDTTGKFYYLVEPDEEFINVGKLQRQKSFGVSFNEIKEILDSYNNNNNKTPNNMYDTCIEDILNNNDELLKFYEYLNTNRGGGKKYFTKKIIKQKKYKKTKNNKQKCLKKTIKKCKRVKKNKKSPKNKMKIVK